MQRFYRLTLHCCQTEKVLIYNICAFRVFNLTGSSIYFYKSAISAELKARHMQVHVFHAKQNRIPRCREY